LKENTVFDIYNGVHNEYFRLLTIIIISLKPLLQLQRIREGGAACGRRKTPQEFAYEPLAALGLFSEELRKMFFCARRLPRLPVAWL